jgi:hypothetical protein
MAAGHFGRLLKRPDWKVSVDAMGLTQDRVAGGALVLRAARVGIRSDRAQRPASVLTC